MFFKRKNKVYTKEEYKNLNQSIIEDLMRTDYRAKFEYARRKYKVGVNQNEFMPLFEECALNGVEEAYDYLGYIYNEGKYVEKNIDKAIQYYKQGIEHGDLTSFYDLSNLLYHENNFESSISIALQGFSKGCKNCAAILFQCYDALGNTDETRKWLITGAENDDILKNVLGNAYRDGEFGLEVSPERAFKCYSESINNTFSKIEVGKMLVTGEGCSKDSKRGLTLLEDAARENIWAYNTLGDLYSKGQGVAHSLFKAKNYYLKMKNDQTYESYAYSGIANALFKTAFNRYAEFNLNGFLPKDEIALTCFRLAENALIYQKIAYEKNPSDSNKEMKEMVEIIENGIETLKKEVAKFNYETNVSSISFDEMEIIGNMLEQFTTLQQYNPEQEYKTCLELIEKISVLLKSNNVSNDKKRILCSFSAQAHLIIAALMMDYYKNEEEGTKFFTISQYMDDKVESYYTELD